MIESNPPSYDSAVERNNAFLSAFDESHNNKNHIDNTTTNHNEIEVEEEIPQYLLDILNLLEIADEYFCDPTQNYLKEVCEVVLY